MTEKILNGKRQFLSAVEMKSSETFPFLAYLVNSELNRKKFQCPFEQTNAFASIAFLM